MVLLMHRPMVSSRAGAIGRNMHGSLGPLLAKHGVQLVLAGHEHGYERSTSVQGTVHMVTGGGGAASYAYPGGQPATSVLRTARHHYLQIAFDEQKMVLRAVDDKGAVIDTSVVLPRAAAVDAAAGAAALAA
jgi:acid phosphatase